MWKEKLVGTWTSNHMGKGDNRVETAEYSIAVLEDGTYTVNNALSHLLPVSIETWSLHNYDAAYGFTYIFTLGNGTSGRKYCLSADAVLESWYKVNDESIVLCFMKA